MTTTLESCGDFSQHVSIELSKHKDILFLGHEIGEAVAAEGALKMKELTYLHCQSFNLMNIANNFFSFVKIRNSAVPCIFVILEEQREQAMFMMTKL